MAPGALPTSRPQRGPPPSGIGAGFDGRDGTDGHARSLERMRALADEQYDVPIRSDAFVAPAPTTTPVDADGWFERAMQLAQFGAEHETLEALPHALAVEDPAKRAQLLSMRLGILIALDRAEEACSCCRSVSPRCGRPAVTRRPIWRSASALPPSA